MYAFEEFPKIVRLRREIVITEKVDGTNAQIALVEITNEDQLSETKADLNCVDLWPGLKDGDAPLAVYVGSRTRWLNASSSGDNFGFCKWVIQHKDELRLLGPGRHYGEWYGLGIQRNYGLPEKRFALFNVGRWNAEYPPPACCQTVPILMRGETADPDAAMRTLQLNGSVIAPGFMKPEGIVVFHSASRQLYKLTFNGDGGKWREQTGVVS